MSALVLISSPVQGVIKAVDPVAGLFFDISHHDLRACAEGGFRRNSQPAGYLDVRGLRAALGAVVQCPFRVEISLTDLGVSSPS